MIFHPPRKIISQEFSVLQIGKQQIGCIDYVRYLGILLDDQLNLKNPHKQPLNSYLCGNLTKC